MPDRRRCVPLLPRRASAQRDALSDPHRIAAARRLFVEVPGAAAFDRLSRLAARLLDSGHAKVTLFTDADTVIGGHGLPPGVVGGPALLTGALSAITVNRGAPLIVPDARADERMAHLDAVTTGQVRAYLGAPLVAASGHVVGVLTVYDERPRDWSVDDADLLQQLAASVVAELELSATQSAIGASRARLEIALEASSVGIWERDLRTGVVYWDERCAAIFGLDGAVEMQSTEELLTSHIHPDDRDLVQDAMRDAMATDGQYTVESRVLRTDGEVRWTVSRGRVISNSRGEQVRIIGTTVDVTEAREQADRRLAAMQRAAAIAEVAAEMANASRIDQLADISLRGAQVLGAESGGISVFDPDGGALRVHLGRRLSDAIRGYVDQPPEGVLIEQDDSLPTQYVAAHGEPVWLSSLEEGVARFPRMADIHEFLGVRAIAALPLRVEGRVVGSFVATWNSDHEIDEDHQSLLEALAAQIALSVSRLRADAERSAAQVAMVEANQRLQLLADAGRVLSGTLDIAQQIDQLADLVVPSLGDWCWLVVVDDQGRLHDLTSAHRDPARREEVEDYVRVMVRVMTEEAGARVVTRTGRPLIHEYVDWTHLERVLPDPLAQEALHRLGLGSSAIVPLVGRGHVLGALGLFTTTERGPLSPAEIETATEIGRRAGLALHHARLFGQQRALADALQRSMLTDPPEADDREIVVKYVPAAAGAEIGGDWYDAFCQPDGSTVLAIGDVVGHDTRAAAAMGQVRGLLRGISYNGGGTPAEVLTGLDRAIAGLELDTMATALVARLEDDGCPAGRTLMRWASAGHPAPIMVTAEGKVHVLDDAPADLLLGVSPEALREDRLTQLEPGATVLLYTDGLVERRDRDIDEGTQALVEVLRECAGLPLDELCNRVVERLFLPDAEDDVAVLAVRLRRRR